MSVSLKSSESSGGLPTSAFTAAATKHTFSVANLPDQSEPAVQFGSNRVGHVGIARLLLWTVLLIDMPEQCTKWGASSQNSLCQNAFLNSVCLRFGFAL
jgi:hypothetical protein